MRVEKPSCIFMSLCIVIVFLTREDCDITLFEECKRKPWANPHYWGQNSKPTKIWYNLGNVKTLITISIQLAILLGQNRKFNCIPQLLSLAPRGELKTNAIYVNFFNYVGQMSIVRAWLLIPDPDRIWVTCWASFAQWLWLWHGTRSFG